MNPWAAALLRRNKNNTELAQIRCAVIEYAMRHTDFVPDQVRGNMEAYGDVIHHPRLFGPAVASLHKEGYLQFVGWGNTTNPRSHSAPTRRWKWSGKKFDFKREERLFRKQLEKTEQLTLF